MATISVYRPLQRCHGIKFLLNWILRPNQFLQKFLSCFQFPAADIIWVILNIWPNVVFLLLKGRDMQHVTCWWLPWYKMCSFTRDDKSGYNVRGRSWQHYSCFPHCSQESSELSQAEPVLSWNLFRLQAAAPSHIPTPALPAPPAQLLKLLLPVPHITFTPSSSIWSWSRFEGLNLQWFRAMSMRTTGNFEKILSKMSPGFARNVSHYDKRLSCADCTISCCLSMCSW